ncbi:MAG: 2OG-Fe(II) oxygenase [Proteobacteria bacterium]|nr:2OG-Fe(II) oxygenase [Pseudomonadota bacterium]
MAYQSIWHSTKLPDEIISIIESDIKKDYSDNLVHSLVDNESKQKHIRNSKNCWIPSSHWIGGFIWNYVNFANNTNFLYDLSHVDGESIQYTVYNEGEYYSWHADQEISSYYKLQATRSNHSPGQELLKDFANVNVEKIRKLSFSLLLNDDYEGGQFQFLSENGELYEVPKEKGLIIIFDSRTRHRVRPVKKGIRKSLVGWVVGPRWK